jgi:hypothetical protein
MASIRNAEIETAAVRVARLEKEIAVGKATMHQVMSQIHAV